MGWAVFKWSWQTRAQSTVSLSHSAQVIRLGSGSDPGGPSRNKRLNLGQRADRQYGIRKPRHRQLVLGALRISFQDTEALIYSLTQKSMFTMGQAFC